METPFVVLCRPDCKGLCPVCGANLNEEDWWPRSLIEEDRLKAKPACGSRLLDPDHKGDEKGDAPVPGEQPQTTNRMRSEDIGASGAYAQLRGIVIYA